MLGFCTKAVGCCFARPKSCLTFFVCAQTYKSYHWHDNKPWIEAIHEPAECGSVQEYNMEADAKSFGFVAGQILLFEVQLRGEANMSTIFYHKFKKSRPMVISIFLRRCCTHSSEHCRSGGHLQSLSKETPSGKCNDERWKAIFLPNLIRLAAIISALMYD
jgi:hypothetical protein